MATSLGSEFFPGVQYVVAWERILMLRSIAFTLGALALSKKSLFGVFGCWARADS